MVNKRKTNESKPTVPNLPLRLFTAPARKETKCKQNRLIQFNVKRALIPSMTTANSAACAPHTYSISYNMLLPQKVSDHIAQRRHPISDQNKCTPFPTNSYDDIHTHRNRPPPQKNINTIRNLITSHWVHYQYGKIAFAPLTLPYFCCFFARNTEYRTTWPNTQNTS